MDGTEIHHCVVREIAHILAKVILRLANDDQRYPDDSAPTPKTSREVA